MNRLVPALIALVTFAAFLPALQNQFVNLDDDKNLLDNPRYRGLGWTQLRWMWTTFLMGHYIPLTWMTLGLDYLVWGMNPFGYHLTSLLLHATNAAVFYVVATRILTAALAGAIERHQATVSISAGFAALLFALHPLRVESVAWATERRDVLSGLFYLSSILAYLRARADEARRRSWYWLSVGLFGGALLSKSMAVSLPVVLLILDVYPLRRLGGAIGWWGERARRVYIEKIPFVLLAAAASALAFLALLRLDNMASLERLSVPVRLAVSAYGLSFYLWKTVLPLNLSPLYEMPVDLNPWAVPFTLSYGVVLAVTALALACRRLPGLPAAWLAYVVILLPVLGIFQNGPQITADRYTYLAGLGWALLAGAGLLACWQAAGKWLAVPAACAVVGLGVLTWHQVQVWHDTEKLWTRALSMDPKSARAHYGLGSALADQGKPADAIPHYRRAVEIMPDYAEAHYNWGSALAHQGNPAEAIEHYQKALHISPHYADARNNWGVALVQQGKWSEAIEQFRQAVEILPDHVEAQTNWGATLIRLGRLSEAIERFRRAVEMKPDHADAHIDWGAALAQQGKWTEAIEHYAQALQIKPDKAEAHNNWGAALVQQGRLAEAIDHFQQALRIKPDYANAHDNWGRALARQGKPAEAMEHYQQALKLK